LELAGSAGAFPFSAMVGDLALVLVGQCLLPVKWDVALQLGHLRTMWEHDLPLPAMQYICWHVWSLVWWCSWQNLQTA